MQLHTPGAEASQLCKSSMQVHGVAGVEGKTVKDPVVMYQHSGTRTLWALAAFRRKTVMPLYNTLTKVRADSPDYPQTYPK